MAKPPRFTPKKTDAGTWRLSVPGAFTDTGKRRQFFYKTHREAKEAADHWRDQAKKFGEQSRSISPTLAEAAVQAEAMLKPLGVGLLEAVQDYVMREEANRSSRRLEEAVEEFHQAHEHWSASYTTAQTSRGKKLVESFGDRQLASITAAEITKHLEDTTGGPDAWNLAVRLIRSFWRWSAKPPRQWCGTDPVDHLETKRTKSGEIGVLTATQVKKLFSVAEKHFPEAVPALAISIFTGMRQAELSRLTPEDITSEGITVPAASAKTQRRRFINMPTGLAAWLNAYPIGESVVPANWNRKQKAIRRLAGWRVWSDLVPYVDPKMEPAAPDNLPPWPENAIRHTNASVLLSTGATVETLGFEFGHTGGSEMLRRHYAGVMPRKEAVAILAIGPNGKKLKTIQAA
jgi:site-specific recombinase XerD